MKKKYSFLFLTIISLLEFYGIYHFSALSNDLSWLNKKNKEIVENSFGKENFNDFFLSIGNDQLGDLLKQNLKSSNNEVLNYAFNSKNPTKFFVEVVSETQYEVGNIVFAEGDVNVFFNNGKLIGDKISFDKIKKELKVEGNVKFYKGEQYLESDYLIYNFKTKKGSIRNVYGILDLQNAKEDFDIEIGEIDKDVSYENNFEKSNIKYQSKTNIALENSFSDKNNLDINNINLDIPQITKWRYKSDLMSIDEKILKSEEVIFTNDPINKPQFLLKSKNLTVEIINEKLKLTSRNTRLIFDEMLSFPIGKRGIFDKDSISRWSFGSDPDKDGIYFSRGFNSFKIFNDFNMNITPYFLIQRTIKGNTSAFVEDEESIFSNKVKQDIYLLDTLGLDTKLSGQVNGWDMNFNSQLDSLNFERLSNASRLLLTFDKSIDLKPDNEISKNLNREINNQTEFDNFIDIKFYGAYRKTVDKGFSGDSEIYLGKGITLNNRRSWLMNNDVKNFELSYDFGEFTSEATNLKELRTLTRNVVNANLVNKFVIWEKQNLDKEIDLSYKYSPEVIKQGLSWNTNINSNLFFYSDDSSQKSISLTTGPELILGDFKNKFFDYSKINFGFTTVSKNGQSPFKFDDIDKTQRINFKLDQQIIGPLLLSYEGYINIDNGSSKYGTFSQQVFGLDLRRRAYNIGAFFRTSDDALGIRFNIYNFGYDGRSSKF